MASILIVGTGAMAGLFGGRLASHADVTFLGSWPEGVEALNRNGIQLETNGHVKRSKVRATTDPSECDGAEHALVLVKSWQTEQAAALLANCLSPDGVALTLQNGLGNIERLQAALGRERVAQGVTTIGATLLAPGRVRPGGAGVTHVAAQPRLEGLVDLLQISGFEIRPVDDLETLVWGKLVVNTAINPLTALLEIHNGKLLERPHARALLGATAEETARVAIAAAINLPYQDPTSEAEQVARQTANNVSSMLQDIRRGAPTEIEAINGAVVGEGRRLEVQTPMNYVLWNLVRAKANADPSQLK